MSAPVIDIATARKPSTNPADLLASLRLEGFRLSVREGTLHVGPRTALTDKHRKTIREHRDALIWELEREGYLALIDGKAHAINHLLEHNERLSKELRDSEDNRKHAETLLELTRIQLGLEREYGSMRRPPPDLPPIPEDVRRFIASRCHPDHNQDSEVSNKVMAWLNGQPRGVRT